MTLRLMRAVWLWAGLLALALLVFLPITGWLALQAGVAIVAVVAIGWGWAARNLTEQGAALVLMDDATLPAPNYQQPVALVCGDGLDALFGGECGDSVALRLTDAGCYLSIAGAQRLPTVVDSVLALRPHWGRQLCVIMVVNPSERAVGSGLAAELKALRHQLTRARRRGIGLPLLLVSYLPARHRDSPWIGWRPDCASLYVLEQGSHLRLAAWQRQAPNLVSGACRLRSVVQWNAAMAWLAESVIAPLTDGEAYDPPCMAKACGVILLPGLALGVPNNLWQRWLGNCTGLYESAPPPRGATPKLPLPDPLLAMLSLEPERAPLHRAGVIALWLFAVAGGIALSSAAWQNTLLARQVSDDLRGYQAVRHDPPTSARHENALAALHQRARVLGNYYRHGEPLALGLGLYRGERLRAPLLQTLTALGGAADTPPAGEGVQLNSLSLFAVGSATLKPDSAKVLINAISEIKARPGWLILVSGHTDAIGPDENNQQLSLARANAVRDWMQQMGSIPAHCFAVQGLGASQPVASNATEQGRAANRRVDIRLVPERGACMAHSGPGSPPPQAAAITL